MSDNDYNFIKLLGEGSFGETWLARDKRTKEKVAIKIFKSEKGDDSALYFYNWEISVLKDVLQKCFPYANCILDNYVENGIPRLVLDYVDGESLEAQRLSRKRLPLNNAKSKNIAYDLVKGIQIIHSQHIVHEDIKEQNLMWDSKLRTYRYIDFGLACVNNKSSPKDFINLKTIQFPCGTYGTKWIASPDMEALRKANPIVKWEILEAHDYWSVGLVLLRWYTFLSNRNYYLEEYENFIGHPLSDFFIDNTRLATEHPLYYLLSPSFIDQEISKIKNDKIREIVSLLLEFDGYKRHDNFKIVVKLIEKI